MGSSQAKLSELNYFCLLYAALFVTRRSLLLLCMDYGKKYNILKQFKVKNSPLATVSLLKSTSQLIVIY